MLGFDDGRRSSARERDLEDTPECRVGSVHSTAPGIGGITPPGRVSLARHA